MLALAGVGVGDAETDEASAGVELLEPGRGIEPTIWSVGWVSLVTMNRYKYSKELGKGWNLEATAKHRSEWEESRSAR